jgi:indole-3-glycerol phosphate synthase
VSLLDEIVVRKREEVRSRRAATPDEALARTAAAAGAPRGFERALRGPAPGASGLRVIAEMKRASPSRGPIRPGADAAAIARGYAAAGAACMSVLTDGPSFDGRLEDIGSARAAAPLPVLRKDFLLDPWQVLEARAAGADAVLLIARILDDRTLEALAARARELGMAALVEVHDRAEMERAARLRAPVIGINNRDLDTLRIDRETTRRLLDLRPEGSVVVSESGFSRREEMEEMARWGVDAFLVGEALMKAPDPGAALAALIGPAGAAGGPDPGGRRAPCR